MVERTKRKKLPDEREAITKKFNIYDEKEGQVEGYITVGFFENGDPGELFLLVSKDGTTLRGLLDALGIAVSIGLQHGVPLETFIDKFSHTRYAPQGWTDDKEMGYAKSILDYVFRWLERRFELADNPPADPPTDL